MLSALCSKWCYAWNESCDTCLVDRHRYCWNVQKMPDKLKNRQPDRDLKFIITKSFDFKPSVPLQNILWRNTTWNSKCMSSTDFTWHYSVSLFYLAKHKNPLCQLKYVFIHIYIHTERVNQYLAVAMSQGTQCEFSGKLPSNRQWLMQG